METETEMCSCYKKDPIFDLIFLFIQVAVLYKVWGMACRRAGEARLGTDPAESAPRRWLCFLWEWVLVLGSFLILFELLLAFSYWFVMKGNDYSLISCLSVRDTVWFKLFAPCHKD